MHRIVEYSPVYFDQLLDLNRSLIDTWFHFKGSIKGKPDNWENLTPAERFHHGGPWNDPDTLKIHLKYYLDIGRIFLLIEENKLLGEIEFHQFGNSIHIDWMMTHPQYRRKGYASKLMQSVVEFCHHHDITTIWAEPEPGGSDKFYDAMGFSSTASKFVRHSNEGGSLDRTLGTLIDVVPAFKTHIYGEPIHDSVHLSVLLRCLLEYQSLMAIKQPLLVFDITPEIQIIDRALPTIDDKRAIFISSDVKLNTEEIEDSCTHYVDRQSHSTEYFITTLGDTMQSWKKSGEIPRLKKSVIS